MKPLPAISIIFPVYNEEESIREVIEDSLHFLKHQDFFANYEIIVVNDGSQDGTAEVLESIRQKEKKLQVVSHPFNRGYGAALAAGFKQAQHPWVLMMDADGQFRLKSIQNTLPYFPDYDMIVGYRLQRRDSLYRIFLGQAYTSIACWLFGLRLKDINCGFKIFKREIIKFNGNVHGGAFYTSIFIESKRQGQKWKEVPIEHFPRKKGKQSGANIKVIYQAIKDVVNLRLLKE